MTSTSKSPELLYQVMRSQYRGRPPLRVRNVRGLDAAKLLLASLPGLAWVTPLGYPQQIKATNRPDRFSL